MEIDQWFCSLNKNGAVLPQLNGVEEYNLFTSNELEFQLKNQSVNLTHYYESQNRNPFGLSTDLIEVFIGSLLSIQDEIGVLLLI